MKPSKTFLKRIQKLQKSLKEDLLLVENSYDLFYLTGLKLSLGHLLIRKEKCCLFIDGRYFEMASKNSPVPINDLNTELEKQFFKGAKTWAFDGDKISYTQLQQFEKSFGKGVSDPSLMKNLRLVKDAEEIAKMRKSADFGYKAYQYIRKKLKVGITESELSAELQIYCLKNGAEKMSFEPIIAFGVNSALPHYRPGDTRLKKKDIVLFDLGVVLDGYCSDMTRVDFVGKPDPKLKRLYDVNHAAQKAALALCRPGVRLEELDLAARKVMAKEGLEELFVHGLGHGIGLEVHEYPRIRKDGVDKNLKLEAGMAITIEPGLYLPGKGGVRYEDTIIITKKGYENLYP